MSDCSHLFARPIAAKGTIHTVFLVSHATFQELLDRLGVRIFYIDEVERRGIAEVMQEALYMVTRWAQIGTCSSGSDFLRCGESYTRNQ